MRRAALFLSLLLLAEGAMAQGAERLREAASPYLRQHADNPVDWYPWGEEALEKARAEGKPIFVSVGYATCHWCHVMEAESFEDAAIAARLNAHFVSIKIDKESRPDLDLQFMFVTEMLTGTGGWPNSVFLTPEGDPFFAGGYFPPEAFARVLGQVRLAWAENPRFVAQEARRVRAAMRGYLAQRAEARQVTPELVQAAAEGLLDRLDPFSGGLDVAPKFPREPLFLFLLDQAVREGDPALLAAVTDLLDGMIRGGIHDHIGGGFHRYAVDPEWHVPHFEKMLYTQALTGRLLVRAWETTGTARYRQAAEDTFDYVLGVLQAPQGGFFAAQDADTVAPDGTRIEGAYYLWTPEDLAPLQDAALVAEVFGIDAAGDLDGANVLHLAEGPRQGPEVARLRRAMAQMAAIRRARTAPALDRKIVVAWNAAMIETLAEASRVLDRPEYFAAAQRAARFVLEDMQTEDGLRRIHFDGEVHVPAQLEDVAGMGLALVALHDAAPDRAAAARYLKEAERLARVIPEAFGAGEHGLTMTRKAARKAEGVTGIVPRDDDVLPSGNALALDLFARLAARAQRPGIERQATHLAAALSGLALEAPAVRGSALRAIQLLQGGETGRLRFAARGAVRVLLRRVGGDRLRVQLQVAEGWHINANAPLQDHLIATELRGAGLVARYPQATIKALTFNAAPLALFEGDVVLEAELPPGGDATRAGVAHGAGLQRRGLPAAGGLALLAVLSAPKRP